METPKPSAECKCYKTNDFNEYAAVMTGCASEWTVTKDCPIHRQTAALSAPVRLMPLLVERSKHESWCASINVECNCGGKE